LIEPLTEQKTNPPNKEKSTVKKTILCVALMLALVSGVSAQQATRQVAPQAAPQAAPQDQTLPTMVAVVDVAQLIKAHPEFKAKQEALQTQLKQAEQTFQGRQQKIRDKQKALESTNLKPGTPDHQKLLDEIANELADFEKDAKQLQRKFALENSKIMYETYQDIKNVIKAFAKARNIAQVTDFREFDPNPAEPQSVAEDMDQKLVWFDERLNVTPWVIRDMYTARGLQPPAASATARGNTTAAPTR
jgi:Skp family chaperone for outer membrane proteins